MESEKKNLPQEDEAHFNKEKRGNHVTFFQSEQYNLGARGAYSDEAGMIDSQQNVSSNLVESVSAPFVVNNYQSRMSGSLPKQIPPMVSSSSPGIIVSQGQLGYPNYTSPSIIGNNTSGFIKADSYVLNAVPNNVEAFRLECLRRIDQANKEKNMEIKIIKQSLRRTQ